MKKITLFAVALFFGQLMFAQVGVGTTTPNVNAQLDVVSATKGLLLPRLTQTEADALATALTTAAEPAGMLIENTTVPCIQRWSGTAFQCLAVVTGGQLGNSGAVQIKLFITQVNGAAAPSTADPGYINLANVGTSITNGGANVSKWYTLNVDPGEFTVTPPPVTSWPENEPNPGITAIWKDNAFSIATTAGNGGIVGGANGGTTPGDGFVENGLPGQVHFWRVNVRNNSGSSSQPIINARLRNPNSDFVTSAVTVFSPSAGSDLQTIIFITIADNQSLPTPGTGNGYVLEFRSGSGNQQVWVESITRISAFAD